ncbi:MAG: PGF-pre-PGF domain-containing protein [Candidatus ainarchaeum sp.]|nr:PGF-pre-PGF domain-containing protein [Candidatus ainarchaeum sp.]
MNKKIFQFPILFFSIILILGSAYAFNPTFYVGDGVSGVSTQCQNPNFNSISSALENISQNNLSNAIVILCQGTYNEDLMLVSELGISIIGENNDVTIKGVDPNSSVINIMYAKDIFLKNLKLQTSNLIGLSSIQSENITFENISVLNVHGNVVDDDSSYGMLLAYTNNITFKGTILVKNVVTNKKEVAGISLNNCDDVTFDTSSFTIKDIESTSNDSDVIVTGLNIIDSNVDFKSNMVVENIEGLEVNGITLNNSKFYNNNKITISIRNIDSMSTVKGFQIINNSKIEMFPTSVIYLTDISKGNAQSFALYLDNLKYIMLGNLNISGVAGDYYTYGIYINNTLGFLINDVLFSENKTTDKSTLVTIINSKGSFSSIKDSEEVITQNSSDFKFINILDNSDVSINSMDVYSGVYFPECINIENNSILELKNANFKECENINIMNKDSQVLVKNSENIDFEKLFLPKSQNSKIEIYKPAKLNFKKDGSPLNINNLLIYNNNGYFNVYFLTNKDNLELDLLYFTKVSMDNVIKEHILDDYMFKIVEDGINEVPTHATLENYFYKEYDLDYQDMPEEFIEMTCDDEGIIKVSNHFYVDEKTCDNHLENSYGCYNIEKSVSLNGNDYKIKFQIPNMWININNVDPKKISLYHLENGEYVKLTTTHEGSLNNYQSYVSKVPSFLSFQIAAVTIDNTNNSGNTTTTGNETSSPTSLIVDENTDTNITTNNNNNTDDCDLVCLENQTLDQLNCICVNNSPECNISCDPDTEILDEINCVCNLIENTEIAQRCNKVCDVGYTLDKENCRCLEYKLDEYNNNLFSKNKLMLFGYIIVIVFLTQILLFKFRKKKSTTKKGKEDKSTKKDNLKKSIPKKIKMKKTPKKVKKETKKA